MHLVNTRRIDVQQAQVVAVHGHMLRLESKNSERRFFKIRFAYPENGPFEFAAEHHHYRLEPAKEPDSFAKLAIFR